MKDLRKESGIVDWFLGVVSGRGVGACGAGMVGLLGLGLGAWGQVPNGVAWGDAGEGKLVFPTEAYGMVSVAAGLDHNIALLERSGSFNGLGWGANDVYQATVPTGYTFTEVEVGYTHSLGLTTQGRVIAWGDSAGNLSAVPDGLRDVIAIDAGMNHSLALTADGMVVAWGSNEYGAAVVPEIADLVVDIAAGGFHSLAVTELGEVIAWGNNAEGQCDVPLAAQGLTVAVAAGLEHSLALLSDGTVVAWGNNDYSQAIVPATLNGDYLAPMTAEGGQMPLGTVPGSVASISAGMFHNVVVTEAGETAAWGDNASGQTDVPQAAAAGAAYVSAGALHNIVVQHIAGSAPTGVRVSPARLTVSKQRLYRLRASALAIGRKTYQWKKDGVAIAGATQRFYKLPTELGSIDGNYTVEVRSANGLSTESAVVPVALEMSTLTLTPPVLGGSIAVTGGRTAYLIGEVAELTATPEAGWRFVGWTGAAAGEVENPLSYVVAGDSTVSADFERLRYDVVFELGTHGTRSGGGALSQSVQHGDAASAPEVTPAAGYLFAGWDVAFGSVTGDLTVSALYSQIEYSVTATAESGWADVNVDSPPVHYGDWVQVYVEPYAGYRFVSWRSSAGHSSTEQTYWFQVFADQVLTAEMRAMTPYELWVAAHYGAEGSAPETVVKAGRAVSLGEAWLLGEDPTDPQDVTMLEAVYAEGAGLQVRFRALADRRYALLGSATLDGDWAPLEPEFVGDGGERTFTYGAGPGAPVFVRLRVRE